MEINEIIVCKNYYKFNISKIEERYKAKYIGDFSIKDKRGWTPQPVSIFYVENPDISKGHTHYMGMFVDTFTTGLPQVYLCKGDSAFEEPFNAIVWEDKAYISCYQHHYVTNETNDFMIDGGRAYQRCGGGQGFVKVEIDKDKLIVKSERV